MKQRKAFRFKREHARGSALAEMAETMLHTCVTERLQGLLDPNYTGPRLS
jgi:hypothetical protein